MPYSILEHTLLAKSDIGPAAKEEMASRFSSTSQSRAGNSSCEDEKQYTER